MSYVYIYIYMYIHIVLYYIILYIRVCVYIYIYIYMYVFQLFFVRCVCCLIVLGGACGACRLAAGGGFTERGDQGYVG